MNYNIFDTIQAHIEYPPIPHVYTRVGAVLSTQLPIAEPYQMYNLPLYPILLWFMDLYLASIFNSFVCLLISGWLFDITQNYDIPLLVSGIIQIVGGLILLLIEFTKN